MNLRPKLEPSRNVSSKGITNRIIVTITDDIIALKQGNQNPQINMIASPQCSNHLPQRGDILTQRSNLTPQPMRQAKNTANDLTRFRHKAG